MRIENENFVLVGSFNTLSLVYLTEYNQKPKSLFCKHIHEVKVYPSADDFTQALLAMLVTNIMSGFYSPSHVSVLNKTTGTMLHYMLFCLLQCQDFKSHAESSILIMVLVVCPPYFCLKQ